MSRELTRRIGSVGEKECAGKGNSMHKGWSWKGARLWRTERWSGLMENRMQMSQEDRNLRKGILGDEAWEASRTMSWGLLGEAGIYESRMMCEYLGQPWCRSLAGGSSRSGGKVMDAMLALWVGGSQRAAIWTCPGGSRILNLLLRRVVWAGDRHSS